jgi:hypothetical protein
MPLFFEALTIIVNKRKHIVIEAGRGEAWQGQARPGLAWQGTAWQGKEKSYIIVIA